MTILNAIGIIVLVVIVAVCIAIVKHARKKVDDIDGLGEVREAGRADSPQEIDTIGDDHSSAV